jgi:hypothetical protein
MAEGKQDELDSTLDAALANYAAVEPRAGLENRVLSNLRAERSPVPDRAGWRWSVAGALIAVALALAWRSGKPSHPVASNRSLTAPQVSRNPQHPWWRLGARNRLAEIGLVPQNSL